MTDVKLWTREQVQTDLLVHGPARWVAQADFDRVVAERDAARRDQVNERDRLSFERDQARAALARATADLDAMTTAALVAESRVRALEEAGDALAAVVEAASVDFDAMGCQREASATHVAYHVYRTVRDRGKDQT